ncbi:hypothetical protein CHARACLAT_021585 [Characodon lateralis]|uniref:Uncharacterized protein n=1 Tax=Characodon lateralis TaxID=208331 RepID=A0ABU7F712_9TELE|nr:hypothetical protein [Characodon lateralis]
MASAVDTKNVKVGGRIAVKRVLGCARVSGNFNLLQRSPSSYFHRCRACSGLAAGRSECICPCEANTSGQYICAKKGSKEVLSVQEKCTGQSQISQEVPG